MEEKAKQQDENYDDDPFNLKKAPKPSREVKRSRSREVEKKISVEDERKAKLEALKARY